jgi:hypothetical protein
MASQKSERVEYTSEGILSHRFNKDTLQTEFKVKWVGFETPTWEPIDCVYMCPKFMIDMIAKKMAERAKSLKEFKLSAEALANHPKFPVLDSVSCSKFKEPIEFIPKGSEEIHWVIDERITEKGTLLWKVLFKSDLNAPRFVRKAVVCYYWPLAACLFLTEWVEKKKRRDQRLRDLQDSEKIKK